MSKRESCYLCAQTPNCDHMAAVRALAVCFCHQPLGFTTQQWIEMTPDERRQTTRDILRGVAACQASGHVLH